MTPKPPFLCAADYVFYIKKQSDTEIDFSNNKYNKMSTLLKKLSEDIFEGPVGFVEDFIDEPNQGITAILDYLKLSLTRQQSPISNSYLSNGAQNFETNKYQNNQNYNQAQRNRDRQQLMKRAMADEFDCLQCLKYSIARNNVVLNKILNHKSGLTSLVSCIVSNLTKSRIIALEILTKICETEPEGYIKVLEALTIMRILFGESVRFKLLVALINSNSMSLNTKNCSNKTNDQENEANSNIIQFELIVLRFINSLLSNAQPAQRVRLQCELEEAGFSINNLEQKIKKGSKEENKFKTEIMNYKKLYIDLAKLMLDFQQTLLRETELKEDVDNLHQVLTKLEKEKITLLNEKQELKEKILNLEDELKKLKNKNFNKFIETKKNSNNHESNRTASDLSNNGNNHSATDSGRWSSDSEEGLFTNKTKTNENEDYLELMKKKKHELNKCSNTKTSYFKLNLITSKKKQEINKTKNKSKNDQNVEEMSFANEKYIKNEFENYENELNQIVKIDENVRNEDIFIYVPTIREKNTKELKENDDDLIQVFNQKQTINNFKTKNYSPINWSINQKKQTENVNNKISSNSSTTSQKINKPQIVNVYPKKSNSLGELMNSEKNIKSYDEYSDEEEMQKLYCLRKDFVNSSLSLKTNNSTKSDQLINQNSMLNQSYKSKLQNSVDTLSTNNSSSLSDANDDYEELIASTLQQKRFKDTKNDWLDNEKTNNDKILKQNYFTNGQTDDLKFKSQNYKVEQNLDNKLSTSNSSSQNALINGEFYLMKSRQSSINSLNFKAEELNKYESLPPSIYGQHLNTTTKDNFIKANLEKDKNSSTLQNNRKEKNSSGKKLASQLQSYFFSGSMSNKKRNEKSNLKELNKSQIILNKNQAELKNQVDSNEKFPLPNTYKKNFIIKGHTNVGLYSNNLKKDESMFKSLNLELVNYKNKSENNQFDNYNEITTNSKKNQKSKKKDSITPNIHELQTKITKTKKSKINKNDIELVKNSCVNLGGLNSLNISDQGLNNSSTNCKLVHQEIALAAKELGSWY